MKVSGRSVISYFIVQPQRKWNGHFHFRYGHLLYICLFIELWRLVENRSLNIEWKFLTFGFFWIKKNLVHKWKSENKQSRWVQLPWINEVRRVFNKSTDLQYTFKRILNCFPFKLNRSVLLLLLLRNTELLSPTFIVGKLINEKLMNFYAMKCSNFFPNAEFFFLHFVINYKWNTEVNKPIFNLC